VFIPRFDVAVDVFGPLRRFGPVVLIPAAWITAGAAAVGRLRTDGLLIAHLVMAAFIAFFLVTGWRALDRGALRAWRAVLVVGFLVTLSGIAGFVGPFAGPVLLGVSVFGWMLVPAAGLAYTARALPEAAGVYGGGAVAATAGAILFAWTLSTPGDPLVALAFGMVALGQTAGIIDAARR
jgi:hypothetical protein